MKAHKIVESVSPSASSSASSGGMHMLRATVVSASPEGCLVRDDCGEYDAQRAFACLVQPEPDDVVLLAFDEQGIAHVITVIERPGSRHTTINVPGDLQVSTPEGSYRVMAQQSVTLAATQDLNLLAGNTHLKTADMFVDFGDATVKGKRFTSAIDVMRSFGEMIDTAVKTIVRRAVTYVRHTDALDQVKAGQMDRTVQGLYNMNSKYTVMLSSKDTKIDAERIHMG